MTLWSRLPCVQKEKGSLSKVQRAVPWLRNFMDGLWLSSGIVWLWPGITTFFCNWKIAILIFHALSRHEIMLGLQMACSWSERVLQWSPPLDQRPLSSRYNQPTKTLLYAQSWTRGRKLDKKWDTSETMVSMSLITLQFEKHLLPHMLIDRHSDVFVPWV